MLTRFVRIQLAIFAIVGIIGVIAMAIFYVQVPTLFGIGRMTVPLELRDERLNPQPTEFDARRVHRAEHRLGHGSHFGRRRHG